MNGYPKEPQVFARIMAYVEQVRMNLVCLVWPGSHSLASVKGMRHTGGSLLPAIALSRQGAAQVALMALLPA